MASFSIQVSIDALRDRRAPLYATAPLAGRSTQQHEIVAVNDLVADLVLQDGFNCAAVDPLDALQLSGAVVDQAACELVAGGAQAGDALAGAEGAGDRGDPFWQQTPP